MLNIFNLVDVIGAFIINKLLKLRIYKLFKADNPSIFEI
jgi:hypothetical protein